MLDMSFFCLENAEKPQTLFFSATLPEWVERTAVKYMTKDRHIIDVIGNEKQRTALTVEVRERIV
jgi:superfamily II DNA/RNA helicase